jgi:hypothetical protein
MESRALNWRLAAYECYRLAKQGDTGAAGEKWLSLNDEIQRAIALVSPNLLPSLIHELRGLVDDVGTWSPNGNGRRWVFQFHHALLD